MPTFSFPQIFCTPQDTARFRVCSEGGTSLRCFCKGERVYNEKHGFRFLDKSRSGSFAECRSDSSFVECWGGADHGEGREHDGITRLEIKVNQREVPLSNVRDEVSIPC
jgi:hypothetical protein